VTTTAAFPDPRGAAHSLIIQAVSILEPFRDEEGEEDHRLGLLQGISEVWGDPCEHDTWASIIEQRQKRWNVARELLESNELPGIRQRIRRRLIQVGDQSADLLCSPVDESQPRDQQIARELRAALEDLAEVVGAITAVHLIAEVES
jgi:hypothetical protein